MMKPSETGAAAAMAGERNEPVAMNGDSDYVLMGEAAAASGVVAAPLVQQQVRADTSTSGEVPKRESRAAFAQEQERAGQQEIHHRPEPTTEYEQIVVETVESSDDERLKRTDEEDFAAEEIQRAKAANNCIRLAMTMLLALLVIAAVTCFWSAKQHRFVVAVVWSLIIFLFVCFAWFVQVTVIQNSRRVFHPYIHMVVDMMATEYRNFKDDMNDYVFLLKDHAEFPDESYVEDEAGDNVSHVALEQASDPMLAGHARTEARKPKSKVFRVLFKPLMPMLAGRKRRKEKRKQKKRQDKKEHGSSSRKSSTLATHSPV